MLKSMFQSNTTVTAYVYTVSNSFTSGVIGADVEALSLTLTGLFYRGSSAETYVSEKLRAVVDAVLLVDPLDVTTAISETSRIVIDSIKYSVIYADNIGEQDKVMLIPLRKFSE